MKSLSVVLSLLVLVGCNSSDTFTLKVSGVSLDKENESSSLTRDSYLSAKVFLAGPYSAGMLSTTLNQDSLIPLSHPYSAAPFSHSGSETVDADFLQDFPEIVDWILIELRSTTNKNSKVAGKAVFIDQDGILRDLDGSDKIKLENLEPGEYHLVIRHRNHLPVMSADKVALSVSNPSQADLTIVDSVIDAQGGYKGMKSMGGGVYAMYTGDVNQDYLINYSVGVGDLGAFQDWVATIGGGVPIYVQNSVYSNLDLNFDGKVKYAGADNDRDKLLVSVGGLPATIEVDESLK